MLRLKSLNDRHNHSIYETQIWDLYAEVTRKKEQYNEAKKHAQKDINKAYITFRSLAAKNAILNGFSMSMSRVAAKLCKIKSDTPIIMSAVDPQMIMWENLGRTASEQKKRTWSKVMIAVVFLCCSFFGQWFL